jgi:hypothetical protein
MERQKPSAESIEWAKGFKTNAKLRTSKSPIQCGLGGCSTYALDKLGFENVDETHEGRPIEEIINIIVSNAKNHRVYSYKNGAFDIMKNANDRREIAKQIALLTPKSKGLLLEYNIDEKDEAHVVAIKRSPKGKLVLWDINPHDKRNSHEIDPSIDLFDNEFWKKHYSKRVISNIHRVDEEEDEEEDDIRTIHNPLHIDEKDEDQSGFKVPTTEKSCCTIMKKGGLVKGKRNKPVPIIAHEGELIVPKRNVPAVLHSSAWKNHIEDIARSKNLTFAEAKEYALGNRTIVKKVKPKKKSYMSDTSESDW